MSGVLATADQRRHALANCIALKQPLTLVPERADYCMELLNSQAAILGRLRPRARRGSVDSLKNKVLDLAKATAPAPEELSESLIYLASVGLRGAKAMDTLKTAAGRR